MRYKIICVLLSLTLFRCSDRTEKLFIPVGSATSGIHFSNKIAIGDSLISNGYEYIYNGGGVAVGDINNDGLQDIYFTGNMVSSKLYLNKGNLPAGQAGLKFEDITERAKVGTSTWANGVAMVDINQDGFKDIYVSVGGTAYTPENQRANLLFINNKDETFTESAAQYGLADTGYGIQSTFFDYDRDGDLDMYLLRNAFVDHSRNIPKPKAVHGEGISNDKLFRNNGNLTFTDVSIEAGIQIEGFGLGVTVSDINDDGWPDVYVSNDFITNDLLWINNQDGTFTNKAGQYLKHQTFNGMGNDVADYNNDGLVDIVVLDMLPEDNKRWKLTPRGSSYDEYQNGLRTGYEPQYVRNTLQLNNGNGTFSEIGQLAGMEATEWSWSALFADYDNDGWKDLFITNGYRKDITNLDFMVYGDQANNMGLSQVNNKERQALLNELPGINLQDYIYRNKGDLTFTDETKSWGMSSSNYSNGAAYADLDNDGDLDLVINNMDEEATVMENRENRINPENRQNFLRVSLVGPPLNREGYGAKVFIRNKGQLQYQYFTPVRGYLSSVEPFLHFGLGTLSKADSVEVIWPDGKYQLIQQVKANQILKIDYASAAPRPSIKRPTHHTLLEEVTDETGINFVHQENAFVDFKVQPILPHMHSRNGPGVAVGDVNGDGLEDFFIGGAAGQSGAMFWQNAQGKFDRKNIQSMDSLSDQLGVLLFDMDNDNDLDLYVVNGGSENSYASTLYQDHLYSNNGHGTMTLSAKALPSMPQSGSCAVAGDYDHDGDLDLFVGGRVSPGDYPKSPTSYLLQNDGLGHFKEASLSEMGGPEMGMVCSALWTDYDNDGWLDLIVVGEFMPVRFFHNQQGTLVDATDATGLENTSGWWNSLVGGDFDQDGDTDYIAGNRGLNSHFHASPEEPLCIYANDFNKDGLLDPVMSYYVQGVKQVGHPRSNLVDQINNIRGRFRTHTDYANATFEQSFTVEELESSYVVCAERFETSYIKNLGKGIFEITALPIESQFSPVYGMATTDYNMDGNLDVMMVGNSYSTEIISGRDDASMGLYLQGDGNGNFRSVKTEDSGFLADNDSKGVAKLIGADGREIVIVGNNSSSVRIYSSQVNAKYYRAGRDDAYALVTLSNGKVYKQEFYFGSTYLSQSSRSLKLTTQIISIKVFDSKGKERAIDLSHSKN
jgi:enediyne biosynthesis protein E4